MTRLTGKRWNLFIWDDSNEEHLARHGILFWEAEEVFLINTSLRRIKKSVL